MLYISLILEFAYSIYLLKLQELGAYFRGRDIISFALPVELHNRRFIHSLGFKSVDNIKKHLTQSNILTLTLISECYSEYFSE